jgi:IMP dehydrogenase
MSLPEFSRILPQIAVSLDDVVLEPASSNVDSKDVDLKTRLTKNIILTRPFIVDDADAEMAIHAAQIGSIGFIPSNMAISKQADIVRKIKRFQTHIVKHPVTLSAESPIYEALEVQQRYGLDVIPIVTGGTTLDGYLVLDDKVSFDDPEKTVSDFLSSMSVITLPAGSEPKDAHDLMQQKNADYIALVDDQNRFTGLVTREDKEKFEKFPRATIDNAGSLRVAAIVGPDDYMDRVSALIDAGVDAILIDMPQGHNKHVTDIITYIRRQRSGHVDVIAGSVVTSEAAISLIDAGADAIKIGKHLPSLTAILNVAEGCSLHNIPVLVENPEHIENSAKAFAAGASAVLITKDIEETGKKIEETLRRHMSETGCPSIKEFNLRPRFVRIAK